MRTILTTLVAVSVLAAPVSAGVPCWFFGGGTDCHLKRNRHPNREWTHYPYTWFQDEKRVRRAHELWRELG